VALLPLVPSTSHSHHPSPIHSFANPPHRIALCFSSSGLTPSRITRTVHWRRRRTRRSKSWRSRYPRHQRCRQGQTHRRCRPVSVAAARVHSTEKLHSTGIIAVVVLLQALQPSAHCITTKARRIPRRSRILMSWNLVLHFQRPRLCVS